MPLKIFKNQSGIWQAHGTVGGDRIRRSLKTHSKTEAREAAAAIEAKAWKRNIYGDTAVRTFGDAAESYVTNGGELRFVAPLLEYFNDWLLKDIAPGDIQIAARSIYPKGSAATRNRQAIVPARAIINHAASLNWCKPIRVQRFKEKQPERVAVDRDWIDAFMAAATNPTKPQVPANPHLAALALFMYQTGARIGEALSLTWADVNLQRAEVMLQSADKNDLGRVPVAITSEMVAALANLERLDLVFKYTGRLSKGVYKAWRLTCERAGLEYVPPHQAGRHSFATAINAAGIDVKSGMEAGRWKDERLYLRTYVHAKGASRKAAVIMEGVNRKAVER